MRAQPSLAALFAVVLVASPAAAQSFVNGKKPPEGVFAPSPVGKNLLIIAADDLGVEQLELYGIGQDFPHTPRIDALAASGVTFLNAWSNPTCSPTRSGLMTGRHAFRTGVGNVIFSWTEALPLPEVTLAEALDLGGSDYATGMFGKWHLGSFATGGLQSANLQGWDHFDGSMLGFAGVQSYYDWERCVDGTVRTSYEYATSVQVDAALAWLATAPEPWICYVPFMGVHSPYEVPPAGLYYENLGPTPTTRQIYKAMVEALDTEMGRLLDGVEQLGSRQPLVIFTADNGTDDPVVVPPVVPGKAKSTLYEGGIHVPLIVSGWKQIPPGSQCGAVVQVLDIFATAADFARVDVKAELPGVTIDSISLRPLLANPQGPPTRTQVYTEEFNPIGLGTPFWHHKALRDSRYKLIVNSSGEFFYDLLIDPTELHNLLEHPSLSIEEQAAYNGFKQKIAKLSASAN